MPKPNSHPCHSTGRWPDIADAGTVTTLESILQEIEDAVGGHSLHIPHATRIREAHLPR